MDSQFFSGHPVQAYICINRVTVDVFFTHVSSSLDEKSKFDNRKVESFFACQRKKRKMQNTSPRF